MSEGGKKSCFVTEGVIPVFGKGVEKIPILSEGVTEIFLSPSAFFTGIALTTFCSNLYPYDFFDDLKKKIQFFSFKVTRFGLTRYENSNVPPHF